MSSGLSRGSDSVEGMHDSQEMSSMGAIANETKALSIEKFGDFQQPARQLSMQDNFEEQDALKLLGLGLAYEQARIDGKKVGPGDVMGIPDLVDIQALKARAEDIKITLATGKWNEASLKELSFTIRAGLVGDYSEDKASVVFLNAKKASLIQ